MFQMQNKREQTPDATGKPAVALEEGAEGRVDAADKGRERTDYGLHMRWVFIHKGEGWSQRARAVREIHRPH